MKKVLSFTILVIMLFSLTACNGLGKETASIEPNMDKSFSADVKLTYGDMEAEAVVKRIGPNYWEAEFVSPNTLAGVKLTFIDNEVTASYKGLSFSVPKSALPVKSMLCSLFNVIDETASLDKVEVINDKEYLLLEGKTDQGEYTIKLDKTTGVPISFEMPNLNLTIEFSNFQLINAETETDINGIESQIQTESIISEESLTDMESGTLEAAESEAETATESGLGTDEE